MTMFIKVLHVEDNDLDAAIYKAKLESSVSARFIVTRSETLEEAKAQIRGHNSFDIILLDLNLPDSEGLDTLEAVLNEEITIPVSVLSGIVQEVMFKKAVGMGAASFLQKGNLDYDVANHLINVVKKAKGQ